MSILGVIPSRYQSTRFPGKPLALIGNKTMIQRVYEQCLKSKKLDRVVVATDDRRIFDHVRSFGGHPFMTSESHRNGTERCGEVAELMAEFDTVINIQGDEPFVHENQIDTLCEVMKHAQIGTLARPFSTGEDLDNPAVVKVVLGINGNALYFSRTPIPAVRGAKKEDRLKHSMYYRHIGIYGFRREILGELVALAPTPLEQAESLEQLRWLEHGYTIQVGMTEYETQGIDTPEDLERSLQWI